MATKQFIAVDVTKRIKILNVDSVNAHSNQHEDYGVVCITTDQDWNHTYIKRDQLPGLVDALLDIYESSDPDNLDTAAAL